MSGRPTVVGSILRLAYAADAKATVLVVALACVNSVSVAASGLSVRWLADSARAAPAMVLWAALLGALAYAAMAAVERVQHNVEVDLTERVDLVLSQRLFRLTGGVPTVEHLERAEYLDRLSQIRRGTETLAGACWGAVGAASSVLSLLLSAWLLALVHPALVLLVLFAIPPLVCARRASGVIGRARAAVAGAERREARLHRMATDAGAAKELRISGSSAAVSSAAAAFWDEATEVLVRAGRRAALWRAAGWALFALGYIGALAFVALLVARGERTPGDLLMVAGLSTYLRTQLNNTVEGSTQLAEGRHVMAQFTWLERHAADRRHTGTGRVPSRLADGIHLRGVSFAYPGTDTPVLQDVNLFLRAGTTVAVVGFNGAGKTSLVKLLTGMYEPTSGDIEVDGTALRAIDLDAWRSRTSAAFQDFWQPQVSAGQAIGLGDLPHVDDRPAVARAAAAANADTVVAGLPAGFDTRLGRVFGGADLSHGQWQRLATGRALMRATPLLAILDEPTAALDPQSEHDLYERFVGAGRADRAAAGSITLLVSHRFSTVRMADHIVVLAAGSVVQEGSHEQLMAAGGHYADLYRTQSRAYTAGPAL
ncbi:ATP-binding cassette domain-containing protein [Actinokineospora globicatena]|uniref:ABC transporter permease n=1 Tax=Actinokineospora globicatena TaxID=103729 RepID=A0A9W6QJ77_9PSEU|nr:ABC transporter ATP-binding protein [Actinokineospora globicatena]GLW89572.1 ABC transporter permease [Actinokineospora globicatena]